VDVAILTGTAWRGRFAGVRQVDILETSLACLVARLSANGEDGVVVPVNNNIVSASDRKLIPQSHKVLLGVECLWALRINFKKLLHVED
jgi:hypothetical protein